MKNVSTVYDKNNPCEYIFDSKPLVLASCMLFKRKKSLMTEGHCISCK